MNLIHSGMIKKHKRLHCHGLLGHLMELLVVTSGFFPTIASQNVYSELVYCQHVKYLYVISNSNLTCKIRHNVTITYEIDLNQHT